MGGRPSLSSAQPPSRSPSPRAATALPAPTSTPPEAAHAPHSCPSLPPDQICYSQTTARGVPAHVCVAPGARHVRVSPPCPCSFAQAENILRKNKDGKAKMAGWQAQHPMEHRPGHAGTGQGHAPHQRCPTTAYFRSNGDHRAAMSLRPARCSQRVFPSRSARRQTHLGADHQLGDAVHHGHGGRGQWHLLLPILALQPAEAKGLLSSPHTESTVSGICAGVCCCRRQRRISCCWKVLKTDRKTGEKSQMLSCSKLSLTTDSHTETAPRT